MSLDSQPAPPAQSPVEFLPPRSALDALLAGIAARGHTARSLFVALSNHASPVIEGAELRASLDRYSLRQGLDAVFQDPLVLEQVDTIWCHQDGDESYLEFHFPQPQTIRLNLALGNVSLVLGDRLLFDVDAAGSVRLREGDIKVRWLMISEKLIIHLRTVQAESGLEEVVDFSAGHMFTQRLPLGPLHPPLPPEAIAAIAQAPFETLSVIEPAGATPVITPPMIPAPAAPSPRPLQTVHRLRGRVRFRVPGLRRNLTLKKRLEKQITLQVGVLRVAASERTGTVLILYSTVVQDDQVAAWVAVIAGGEDLATPSQAQPPMPWHQMEVGETLAFWETADSIGLSETAATTRQREYGPNLLPEAPPRSSLALFLDQFNNLPVMLLGASSLLSVATGGIADAIAIMSVVLVNGVIGYATEGRAERIIASLTRTMRPTALVMRDQTVREIPGEALVPGDIILLKRGMMTPADARLIDTDRLTVDESALTGESVPVDKQIVAIHDENVPLSNRANIVYRGTVITGGSGRAVVIATGMHTEVGLIQRLLGEAHRPETPLQRQLAQLSRQLVLGTIGVCGALLGVGLLRGRGLLPMLKVAVSLMVAAVPEGLPTVATTTLALGLRRLEQRHVLVRRLSVVETLGVVQQICLDKTGTLTLNRMTLTAIYADMTTYQVRAKELLQDEETVALDDTPGVREVLRLVMLCSEVEIDADMPETTEMAQRLRGSPTETALVRAAIDLGLDIEAARDAHPLLRTRLRSDQRTFMDTLHADTDGSRDFLAVKGRPADLLLLCDRHFLGGEVLPLTEEARAQIELENERMAGRALRVLGVAYGEGDGVPETDGHLVWVGLAGIADPPREGMVELMAELRQAGIRTAMITGDQSATAYAIARQIGLSQQGNIEILDSTQLDQLEPDVLRSLTQRVAVFSRVSPVHKLKVVQALQRSGHIVAMTGDGVNDGPALRAADVGIAMGGEGAQVAQEVSDIVVRDDQLETIVFAIEQGRTIYDDIKKAVHFILSSNISEIMVTFGATAAGMGEPLLPMQLLWINLVTDIFPELALGVEPPESAVMHRPPRPPHAPMFDRHDMQQIGIEGSLLTAAALTAYGWGIARYGLGPRASTLAFSTLTGAQLLHAISCRSEIHSIFSDTRFPPDPYLPLAVVGGLALQASAVLLPGLRTILGTTPLSLLDWAVTGAASFAPLVLNEWLKVMRVQRSC